MNEFKDMLFYYRKLHGYTQSELAKKLKVSTSTIGMYESGQRYPTREIEESIADLFNVSISTLRGKTDNNSLLNNELVADFILDKTKSEILTKLHNILGDITEEEGEELVRYAEFIRSKRK